jgi:hypothetical protein
MEVIEHPIKICDPQDQNYDHKAVKDRFDLSLHGDEPVHDPQQKSCCDKCDEYSCKRHIVFSNHSLGLAPRNIAGKLRTIDSLSEGAIERGERLLRLIGILPSQLRNS